MVQPFTDDRKASNSSSLIATVCSGPGYPPELTSALRFEGRDPLVLNGLQLRLHVCIDLAVPGLVIDAVAADILGEQVLGVGMFACPHAQHDQAGVLRQVLRDAV